MSPTQLTSQFFAILAVDHVEDWLMKYVTLVKAQICLNVL